MPVEQFVRRRDDAAIPGGLGHSQQRLQRVGPGDVVGVQDHDQIGAGQADSVVLGGRLTAMGRGDVAESRVRLRRLSQNLPGFVGGAVIDADGFPVAERLSAQALQRCRHRLRRVIARHDDGNLRAWAAAARRRHNLATIGVL